MTDVAGGPGQLVAAVLCFLAVACSGGEVSEAPSATLGATRGSSSVTTTTAPPGPTATEPLPTTPRSNGTEHEVEDAYLHSWDVYADAVLRLDESRLAEAYSGAALETRTGEIRDLATLNTPIQVRVEHDYEVVVVNASSALVLENYLNHSVLLDGTTMQPIEPDPNKIVRREYVFQKERGAWRVTHINAGS